MINYLPILTAVILLAENWPRVLLCKLFRLPLKSMKLRDGTIFMLPGGHFGSADLSMFAEIWYWHFYNPPFFQIKHGDVVIDIGANSGYFTIYAARLVGDGKVFSFEPMTGLFNSIKTNIDANNLKNVFAINSGVAKEKGEQIFYTSDSHNGCHSMYSRKECGKEIKINTVNLEDFCKERAIESIDLLKLDCEGAEYEIIFNLSKDFLKKIKKITLEYHDNITKNNHQEIIEFLSENNFFVDEKAGYLYAINLNYEKNY